MDNSAADLALAPAHSATRSRASVATVVLHRIMEDDFGAVSQVAIELEEVNPKRAEVEDANLEAARNIFMMHNIEGRKTVMWDYCEEAERLKKSRCIWLCCEKGGKMLAYDKSIDDLEHNSIDFRKQDSWFRRVSFYHLTKVRAVEIVFLIPSIRDQHVEVVIRDIDVQDSIGELRRNIAAITINDPSSCGVDVTGHRDHDNRNCENSEYTDSLNGRYCTAELRGDLRQRVSFLEWLPVMLDYHWKAGLRIKGLKPLESEGFVHSYANMKYDTFEDANRPNGTRARGFRLISEWDIKRLVWVVVCAVVLDICVVAVTAVVARQFQTALAVGSYALGLEALLLTMCTLLSAVL